MFEDNFETNLLRMIAAQMQYLVFVAAAQDMYGKSYFSLGVAERAALDQAVFAQVASNFQGVTPEFVSTRTAKATAGFQAQVPQAQTSEKGK
jgi:hypothetical protein